MIARPLSPVFVDWITVQQLHPDGNIPVVNDGRVLAIDEDGLIEWQVDRAFECEGSHDSRVKIQSDGWTVRLSGNVGRFHRRDNIFGFALDEVNRLLFQPKPRLPNKSIILSDLLSVEHSKLVARDPCSCSRQQTEMHGCSIWKQTNVYVCAGMELVKNSVFSKQIERLA